MTSSGAFHAPAATRTNVRRLLEQGGFQVIAESPLGLAVAGSSGAYEQLTGGKVMLVERLMRVGGGHVRYVTHIDIVGNNQAKALGVGYAATPSANIDGVLIQRPRTFLGVFPSPIAPNSTRFHLRVPDEVALGLNALRARSLGRYGDGVVVAMPDSGEYQHPYFAVHGYNVRPVEDVVPDTDPNDDPVGHGTGESANLFAIAPQAALQPIRTSDDAGNLIAAISGFMRGKELNPNVITCSWGGDDPYPPVNGPDEQESAFALEIQHAIEQGILVVFSAGNGQFSMEPQVPGVLAAGGVYMSQDLTLQASNYASGYRSPWFEGITVPTVCGLVGLLPRAQYLMLPIPPSCQIDMTESRPAPPQDAEGDGTPDNDGWALFSGTSAAAPQLAGVGALILGAKPGLNPAQVIEAMTRTATDVVTGTCHPRFNNEARVGRDEATGYGLVNAQAAVQYAIDHF